MTTSDHQQRAGLLWPILTNVAANKRTTTYGVAAAAIGIHHRVMRYALGPIQDYCLLEGLPRLTAIVHGKATGLPGGGYLGVPGDKADLEEVHSFDWASLSNPFSLSRQDELAGIADKLLEDPETAPGRWVLTLTRGDAQRVFRTAVLKAYDYRCAICQLGFTEVLDAAHIIPWASGRRALRMDPRNGICLCANHHRLFDQGRLQINADYVVEFDDPDRKDGGYEPSDDAATIEVHGTRIRLPEDRKVRPDKSLLQERYGEEADT